MPVNTCSLFFGDKTCNPTQNPFSDKHSQFTLLKQIHSSDVLLASNTSELFVRQGDALITNHTGHAIGVLTADCLPIIFFDEKVGAIGVAHAGWRGSVAGIAVKTVKAMCSNFGCRPEDIKAFFGPAAGVRCYEVSKDFEKYLGEYKKESFFIREEKYFFDNSKLNFLQLRQAGVQDICLKHNSCTICNHAYHSYRRSGKRAGRQLTAAVLSTQYGISA